MKYTKELLEQHAPDCTSVRQLAMKLGLSNTGGACTHLKNSLLKHNVDISHFTGQSWNKGKTFPHKRSVEEYLSNAFFITSDKLKKRLIKEGYFEHRCYKCNQTEWLGQPIPIELHHKDHNHSNNNLDNLTIVCPNCHAIIHSVAEEGLEPTLSSF